MKLKSCFSFSLLVFFLLSLLGAAPCRGEIDPFFRPLAAKLARSGFDEAWIARLFESPCLTFSTRPMRLRLTVRESKINYARYLETSAIEKSRRFLNAQGEILALAERKTTVPGEIVTAILLLETGFGEYMGRFPALQTLASQAVADRPEVAAMVYNELSPEEKRRWTKEAAARRLAARVPWFMGELKALLVHLRETNADPCRVNGSYTGAIGFCQFQPSNLKPYGRDGNGDDVVDLFQIEDAIMSAANYLKGHGWRPGLDRDGKKAVLKRYNNSEPYARTILGVAELLAK
ncbi:MAG: lytic murein transglycosylase [Pseudomonadota bacterium]